MPNHVANTPFPRAALPGDAAAGGAAGPLLPHAVLVARLGARPALPAAAVWAGIGINLLRVIERAALPRPGRLRPDAMGAAFVIALAVAVAIFAKQRFPALRRARQGRPARA